MIKSVICANDRGVPERDGSGEIIRPVNIIQARRELPSRPRYVENGRILEVYDNGAFYILPIDNYSYSLRSR